VSILGTDNGPGTPRTGSLLLTISVQRNQGPPVFSPSQNFFASVNENVAIDTSVITVQAIDTDTVSPYGIVKYSIVATTSLGSFFFKINSDTGEVRVKAALTLDDFTPYT
ncbi:hypothetical protein ACJMK2_035667, partial [Sinanodonta woodiana]